MTTVNPTSSAATTGTSATGSSMQQLSGNFDTFLQLLTTQLQNQDPTSPMDTNQFTQQLVEYSQVEQQIDTNTNLQSLITQGGSQNAAYATSYLGKNVTVSGGQGSLTNGEANWTYNLGAAASSATLTVTNASGQTVYTGQGSTNSGNNSFNWNGKDENGNQLADGTYNLSVAAADGSGNPITDTVTSTGQVSEINMISGTPQLMVGSMSVGLSGISSVTN